MLSNNTNPVFTKPAKSDLIQSWATIDMVEKVRSHVREFEGRRQLLRGGYTDNLAYAIGWIIHRMDSGKVVQILNELYADEEYLQVIVGKLAIRLEIGTLPVINFHYEIVRSMVAFQIIQTLMDLGHIQHTAKTTQERNEETGRIVWKTTTFISFGVYKEKASLYIPGVHLRPGTVMQKRLKVRNGGKALKLNKSEKDYLRSASQIGLKLINIDPDQVRVYLEQTEWYRNAIEGTGEVRIDKLVLNDIVSKQVEKFSLLQQEDCFYLSMWLDYRTRSYYDLTEMGFNPHGKTFETSLYELAEARIIDDRGADALKYSAVVIIDGRTHHSDAEERFDANVEHYLAELRKPTGDMGKDLYNSRLAQAIDDYYNEEPSRFLLSEDATNGGLQHGGIGFRSPKMMIGANVGGHPDQLDSHGKLQESLGLETRQMAKDIHQPLLHGSSIRTVASVLDISTSAAKAMMVEAYGNEVLNISAIADWGVAVASNENTSLLWNTTDGFRAQSIAYTESVPLDLYALSNSTLKSYTQTKIHKEMPMFKDAKGNPTYGRVGDDKAQGKTNKLRGLYANITHSIDGTSLRMVGRALVNNNTGGMFKHDNFLVHANDMHIVRKAYKDSLLVEFDACLYEQAIDHIIENYEGNKPPKPTLFYGTATKDMIEESHYFLSA